MNSNYTITFAFSPPERHEYLIFNISEEKFDGVLAVQRREGIN